MITVAQMLTIPSLTAGRPEILAGEDALDQPVRWVHVSDLPDLTRLLDGGEVVLTTGLPLGGSPREAGTYIDLAVEAGAVAVVVELNPSLRAIPPAAVERAAAASLPLVALRRRVRFVDVTQHVHRSLVSDQLARVSFAERVHTTFTELGLRRADSQSIVDAAAHLLDGPVVLENQRRQVIASSGRIDSISDWERRSRGAAVTTTTAVVGPENWIATPVGLQGRLWGRLVAPASDDVESCTVVLERAAQALEIQRMIDREDVAQELRLHGRVISSLIAGEYESEADTLNRLESVGVSRGPGYVCLVIDTGHQENPERIVAHVRDELRRREQVALVGHVDAGTVAALVVSQPGDVSWLRPLADTLRHEDSRILIGAGPWTKSALATRESFAQARRAVEIASLLPDHGEPVVRLRDLRLHRLLDSLAGDLRTMQFVDNEIGAVLAHDARTDDDMLGLLRIYLAENGNVTRVAQATHRNRSSLYRRLRRLATILGHPLDDAASRTSLTVALMAYDLRAVPNLGHEARRWAPGRP